MLSSVTYRYVKCSKIDSVCKFTPDLTGSLRTPCLGREGDKMDGVGKRLERGCNNIPLLHLTTCECLHIVYSLI